MAASATLEAGLLNDSTTDENQQNHIQTEVETNWFGKQGLKVMHMNIHYLFPKFDEVKFLMSEQGSVDIISFCETFLNDSFPDNEFQLHDYKLHRKDRKTLGGGVLVYVRDELPCERRLDIENDDMEIIWLEIRPPKQKAFILGCVYRPPSSPKSWISEYEKMLEQLLLEGKEIIVMGDFNINLLDNSNNIANWINFNDSFNLKQVVQEPTRTTPSSATLIDHIYTNTPCNIKKVSVPQLSLSDHFPVCFTRKTSSISEGPMHKVITYRNMKKFNENYFLSDLQNQPWNTLDIFDDPNDALDYFSNLFLSTVNAHAPLKTRRVKHTNQPNWFTTEIQEAIRNRNNFKRLGLTDDYKEWRKKVKNMIKNAKKSFFTHTINDNHKRDPKLLWKNLKDLSGNALKSQTNFINNEDGIPITDPESTANVFNQYFTSIFQSADSQEQEIDNFQCSVFPESNFELPLVTEEYVLTQLKKIDPTKSTGLDGISAKFLKMSANIIATPVTKVLNLSIANQTFPNQFKYAKITPLHKKGSTSDKKNYRPISILPVLSKILERHVADTLKVFLESNQLLYKYQSGFRKNHSCETALTCIIDRWVNAINDNKIVGTIFLDLSKAFDLVHHPTLIKKLARYHISPSTIAWFKSYLEDRCQRVCISGKLSEPGLITSGVPQGSVLGPILFILYINDLPVELTETFTDIFADDTTVTATGITSVEVKLKLQNALDKISTWCLKNCMALNAQKTKSMSISPSNKTHTFSELYLENDKISTSESERLLGIQVDKNLSWKYQIEKVIKSCNSRLYLLQRIKYYLDIPVRKMFYNAYILPHLDYCCSVWGECNMTQMDTIVKFQKRAARIILDCDYDTPSDDLFLKLNWMKFPDRVKYRKSILVFKSLNTELNTLYLKDSLKYKHELHNRNLRSLDSQLDLYIPKPRLEFSRKSFSYSGPKIWNSLPVEVRNAKTITEFKSKYVAHWKLTNLPCTI